MTDDPFNYSGKLAYLRRACTDAHLQRTDLAVLSVLVGYANLATGQTYVSVATVVKESAVPKSTALRAIRRVEQFGWISADKRHGATTTYTLTSPHARTSATWNATGAIQNLRRGKTGSNAGTNVVPMPGHKQKKAKAIGKEQTRRAPHLSNRDSYRGVTYTGTPLDEIPEYLRPTNV